MKAANDNSLPTVAYLRECFDYDPKTGVLTWRERPRSHFSTARGWNTFNSTFAGKVAGNPNRKGHLKIGLNGRHAFVHRIAWAIIKGIDLKDVPPEIDHIDLNKANNREVNLRGATTSGNQRNVGVRKDNTSGYKGVSWNRDLQKWAAYIGVDGRQITLGWFVTIEEAAATRAEAQHLHGEFARLTNDNKNTAAIAA